MRTDTALEADILSAVLHDSRLVGPMLRVLEVEDFTTQSGRQLFTAIANVAKRDGRQAVAPATVRDELRRQGADERAVVTLLDPLLGMGAIGSFEPKCRRLRDLRRHRLVEQALSEASRNPDTEVALSKLEEIGAEVARLAVSSNYASLADVIDELMDEKERELREEQRITTGLPTLDTLLAGGLAPGWFAVVGARTGIGKTTLAVQVATRALLAGHRVLYVSLEETRTQIAERVLRHAKRIRRPRPGELDPLFAAATDEKLRSLPLLIETTPNLEAICATVADAAMASEGLGLVVVDYIGLVQVARRENRVQELSEVTMRLKNLAMNLRVPILGAAQVNRSPMSRSDRRPLLSDLRDSGSVEQDADVVMFLHHEGRIGDPAGELLLSKNRYGSPASLDVLFDYPIGRVMEKAS